MTRKMLGLWVVAAAAGLLVPPASAQGPIRIGASLSLTGTYAEPGSVPVRGLPALRARTSTPRAGSSVGRSSWWSTTISPSPPPACVSTRSSSPRTRSTR